MKCWITKISCERGCSLRCKKVCEKMGRGSADNIISRAGVHRPKEDALIFLKARKAFVFFDVDFLCKTNLGPNFNPFPLKEHVVYGRSLRCFLERGGYKVMKRRDVYLFVDEEFFCTGCSDRHR